MSTVTSKDGTVIAYDRSGEGPVVILMGGVLSDRSQQAPLAALLAERFTVYNYDRRGHGQSGDTPPYAVEREIEDLEALIDQAGGSAFVYGTSGMAILALEAAALGLSPKIKKLALWEPPYILPGSRPVPQNYTARLTKLLAAGRRGDMIELFFTDAVGMPAEFVAPMRSAPLWPAQEALAHTLIYNAEIVRGDFSLPAERLASVTVPTLVIDGGEVPWMSRAADAVADALPNAQRRTLQGQPHNVAPEAIAPVLAEFFAG